MAITSPQECTASVFNYHLLSLALDTFKKNIPQLTKAEYDEVYRKASKSYELESLVIAAPETTGLVISEQQVTLSVAEIASRYEDEASFIQDLGDNGLDENTLRQALYRELLFDNVMQKIGAKSAGISDLDVRLFYEMHNDRFEKPEVRVASHILITINPDYPENTRVAANSKIVEISEKLAGRVNRFHDFAKRYSECPTAMDGGKLGDVKRGQLFPELDTALFSLEAGHISSILESEMGFHLLLCEKIKPAKRIPLSKAAPDILEILEERQKRNCQKAWITSLKESNTNSNTGKVS